MPLKLIPPGRRKGSRFWYVRGTVGGRSIEVSAKTADKAAAERFAAELAARILDGRVPRPGEAVTFAKAAALYSAWKRPSRAEEQRIARLVAALGRQEVGAIRHADLVRAADDLYPAAKASSRNRSVITIASAVLHYAARNGWCEYRRIERFREPRPVTRALTAAQASRLLAASEGDARILLLWLFRTGTRIGDALGVEWHQIDLAAGTVRLRIAKTDEWRVLPLHEELREALANHPARTGRIFPYLSRWRVYRALEPVAKAAGIPFTPHMARHSLGTWLNETGAGLRTIMAALGHRDPKSSIRYQDADTEIIRAAAAKLAPFGAKKRSA